MTPPDLSARDLLGLYRRMKTIRVFEDTCVAAHKAGEIPGYIHSSAGQEAVPVGVCAMLGTDDRITSTHRGHGHGLAKGADLQGMMLELYGRVGGLCGGKGGSMHVADFSVGMLGANGIVAGGIPIAVGAAQGLKLMGSDAVVACFFGDGAVNRGPFLEGLNWAAIYSLPVLFVCEDNTFSAFTHSSTTTAGPGPLARAESCGVTGRRVDGNDVVAVREAAGQLIGEMRAGGGPRFLWCRTYRFSGHVSVDPAGYRSQEDLDAALKRDPLLVARGRLAAMGAPAAETDRIDAEIETEITRVQDIARKAPFPPPEDAFTDVQDMGSPALEAAR
ncbi:MAG: thiamine pyrophosphate-dependent dehydrogenase E1 component subunit alpha [Beijerinckiaceae bacterium]